MQTGKPLYDHADSTVLGTFQFMSIFRFNKPNIAIQMSRNDPGFANFTTKLNQTNKRQSNL